MPGFLGRAGCVWLAGDDVGVRLEVAVDVVLVMVWGFGSFDVAGDARAAVGVVVVRVWAT